MTSSVYSPVDYSQLLPIKTENCQNPTPTLQGGSHSWEPQTLILQNQQSQQLPQQQQKQISSSNTNMKKEGFVNLVAFPAEFANEDDALLSYNNYGQWHKIQFKIGYRKRNEAGVMVGFGLVCTKRQFKSFGKNVDQGLKLRDDCNLNCPVIVRFKWRNDKRKFVRSPRMMMHHSHTLDIKEKSNINNKHIQAEIQTYVECKIPPYQIHKLINEKFQTNVNFEHIYGLILNIQSHQSKETQSDIKQLINLLEQIKVKDDNLRFAYEYDEGEFSNEISQMMIQTSIMRRNYRLYHDVMFMDATYKTNFHSLALTVFSGVNNEGKNVVLGFALVKRETMDTYKWLLKNLKRFNDDIEPGTLLTDFDPSMCGAIEGVLKNTQHLLCQWHMQQNFKKHFMFLKRIHQGQAKLLYKYIVYDLIYEENYQKFQTTLNIIFQHADLVTEAKLTYLRNLMQIKEKWTTAYAPDIFLARTHTTSRIESINSQIKARVHSRSTLVEIFQMFQDLEQRLLDRIQGEQRNELALHINHPMLNELYKRFTRKIQQMVCETICFKQWIIKKNKHFKFRLDNLIHLNMKNYLKQLVTVSSFKQGGYTVSIYLPSSTTYKQRLYLKQNVTKDGLREFNGKTMQAKIWRYNPFALQWREGSKKLSRNLSKIFTINIKMTLKRIQITISIGLIVLILNHYDQSKKLRLLNTEHSKYNQNMSKVKSQNQNDSMLSLLTALNLRMQILSALVRQARQGSTMNQGIQTAIAFKIAKRFLSLSLPSLMAQAQQS
ncbi:UNKNOWN [Stylonychia lemnae]|uniref:MULE transposase domain-containing protein n=1 Tax=Stylonychia lemnae TaxID=5949 RepID=A0A078AUM3_STYLE|nr:UNKNOWN [Stylonychia lemnae]|eukprot:CDW84932.1 UNKNOWN [Stylonychia lemnae]